MAAPDDAMLACDDAGLRRALSQALRASNRALHADAVPPAPPAFRYRSCGREQLLPGRLFLRPYTLRLQTLELTLHGYHLVRRCGWGRTTETCFSTRRPPWWRRLLRQPPLLTLTIRAEAGATRVGVTLAPHSAAASAPMLVRLDASLQAELTTLHAGAAVRRTLPARLRDWLQRRRAA